MRKNNYMNEIGKYYLSLWVLLLAAGMLSCNSGTDSGEKTTEDNDTPAEEWIVLFDGDNLDAWRTLGSDSIFTVYWKVEDDLLKKIDRGKVPVQPDGQPREGGDLMTKETFENFELTWEWALFENGNSGLKYNVSEEMSMSRGSKHSALGFEYQMIDDDAEEYEDLKPAQFTGALYDLIPAENPSPKPLGEFNESRLIVDGNQVEHWLNGRKVLSYEFGSDELENAYAESKFAEIPGFIEKRNAHIVLQDHITEAWFRNIKIRRL